MKITDAETRRACLHEAGHAVVGALTTLEPRDLRVRKEGREYNGPDYSLGRVVQDDASPVSDLEMFFFQFIEEGSVDYAFELAKPLGLHSIAGGFAEYICSPTDSMAWRTWRDAMRDYRKSEPSRYSKAVSMLHARSRLRKFIIGNTGDAAALDCFAHALRRHKLSGALWEYWSRTTWNILHDDRVRRAVAEIANELHRHGEIVLGSDEVLEIVGIERAELEAWMLNKFAVDLSVVELEIDETPWQGVK